MNLHFTVNLTIQIHIFSLIMLQDTQTIRYYQRLSDALVEMWNRGYRNDELRLYLDGYLAALRHNNASPILSIVWRKKRFLYDPFN